MTTVCLIALTAIQLVFKPVSSHFANVSVQIIAVVYKIRKACSLTCLLLSNMQEKQKANPEILQNENVSHT